jgi:four helix bundle protein
MKIVEEECDESLYWMELIAKINEVKSAMLADLMTEADEILCIVVASIKTARSHKN